MDIVYYIDEASAKGIWSKVSGSPHPHAACVKMMTGKVDDPHAFCAAAEKSAVGTTPAERAAKKHADDENYSINGIEIFGTGVHNGDPYNERDLDDMVDAFKRLDFEPPVKSGHSKDTPGMPALGYVSNLRRMGSKLVADFVNLPKIVHDYVRKKRFNRVSSEVYWNLKRGDGTYRRALKAVALLGADIPAVAGLRPLHELFADAGDVHTVEAHYSSQGENHGGNKMTDDEVKALQTQLEEANLKNAELEAKAKADAEALAKLTADNKTNADGLATLTKRFEDMSRNNNNIDDVRRNAELAEARAKAESADKARLAAEASARAAREEAEAAQERIRLEQEKVAELEEKGRRTRIDRLVATVKVPAVRRFVAQYADMATRVPDGELKVYVQDLNGGKVEALRELEEVVKLFNPESAKLFTLHSTHEDEIIDGRQPDSPDHQVDRLTKAYMKEHNVKDYAAAMKSVLDEDPGLKEAYVKRRGSSGQAA